MTPEDAEAMRLVRNSCREFMTFDTHEISVEEQQQWFARLDRQRTEPYVLHQGVETRIIGYGLISRREWDRWYVSGGLLPEWRGQGYGLRLFRALVDNVRRKNEPCWLAVRPDNERAKRLYESLGFEVVGRNMTKETYPLHYFIMRRL